jgi:Phage stabilisation protein
MAVPIVGPSYTLATRKADIQRSVNMHLVGMESPGKEPFIMDSIPGLTLFASLGSAIRGAISVEGRCFVVAGSTLYEVSSAGTATSKGSLSTSTGVVSMAYGISQLVLVDGPNGYVLTLATNVFAQITSAGFYGSVRVRFLDNYFLFVHPNTQQFYISAINNAASDDPLDFASAESSPDNLITLEVDHSEIWLFGEGTTEVWLDYGAADFPFQRNRGASIEIGCQAANSVQKLDNSVFWIGQDINGSGIVFRSQGFQAQRISTQAVEQAIQASTDLSSAVAYTYQDRGLSFYCINAPGLTSTWCYEVSTGSWHERCDLDTNGNFTQHRAQNYVFAFGKRLLGGSDGNVYELSRTTYTNYLDPLVRLRVTPHDAIPGRLLQFFSAFYLDCTTGEAALGVTPFVELSWSKDSGASWSNPIMRSLGLTGQRYARLLWTLLGSGRDRVWRIRFSGNAPFSIVDGAADSKPGAN